MVRTEDSADGSVPQDDWVPKILETLDQCSDLWKLNLTVEMISGLVGYLVEGVDSNGTPIVVKLRAADDQMRAEAACLKAFAGRGSVHLLDSVPQLGALLLERVQPGDTLDACDDIDIDVVVADVIGALETDGFPSELRSVEEQSVIWADKLNAPVARILVPPAVRSDSADALTDLATTQGPSRVIHGDLHVGNVLKSDRLGFAAIDPKGFVGELEFEAGWWLRDPPANNPGDADKLARRLDVVVDRTGADRERTLAWAQALSVVVVNARSQAEIWFDAERHAECAMALQTLS